MAPPPPAPAAAAAAAPVLLRPRVFGVGALGLFYIATCVPGPLRVDLGTGGGTFFAALQAAYPVAFTCGLKVLPVLALAHQALQLASVSGGTPGGAAYARLVAAGLAVSAVGDALLETDGLLKGSATHAPALFLGGLGAFLAAHLLYIAALRRRAGPHSAPAAVGFAGAAAGIYAVLHPGLPGDLVAPVAVYAAVLAAMGYAACTAAHPGAGGPEARRHAIGGALTFMASDALLALDAFGPRHLAAQLTHPKLAVMVTYYLAQAQLASTIVVEAPAPVAAVAAVAGGGGAPAGGEAPADAAPAPSSGKKPRSAKKRD